MVTGGAHCTSRSVFLLSYSPCAAVMLTVLRYAAWGTHGVAVFTLRLVLVWLFACCFRQVCFVACCFRQSCADVVRLGRTRATVLTTAPLWPGLTRRGETTCADPMRAATRCGYKYCPCSPWRCWGWGGVTCDADDTCAW